MQHDYGGWIELLRGLKSGMDRTKHRGIRIADGPVERPISKRSGNGIGLMAEDYNHIVADRANGIIRRGDKRFDACGAWPRHQLFRATHATAATCGENDTDAAG
jgi:hypothetical protein